MKIQYYFLSTILLYIFSSCSLLTKKNIYPQNIWEKNENQNQNILDLSRLQSIDSLMRESYANGALIKDGKLIKEWTYDRPSNEKIEVQSITKSVVSLLLGIAIDEGLINNINDEVIKYFPAFNVGPYSSKITFKHLVTVSSGIEAKKYGSNYGNPNNMPPGIDARYHNDHFHQLAMALTYIYDESLMHILEERVLKYLHAKIEWSTDGEVVSRSGKKLPVYAGYAFTKWTATDLAKFGYLYLHKGKWEDRQIVSGEYIENSLSPIRIPLMISRPNQEVSIDSKNTYGYGFRGIKLSDNKILWYASGNGGQFCAIIPEDNIVFVKINGYTAKYKPYRGLIYFKDLIPTYLK